MNWGLEVARNLTQYQKSKPARSPRYPVRAGSQTAGGFKPRHMVEPDPSTRPKEAGLSPALAYRQSRQPWRFVVRMHDINQDFTGDCTATLELDGFVQLVRERL